jgi:uncharacterized surface anchored protein
LNNIAKCGSELGNFFFIDTSTENSAEQVRQSLAESLDMAIEGDNPLKLTFINDLFQYNETHKLEVNFEYDDEESKEGQLTVKQVTLTVQAIVNSAVLDGEIQVRLNA